MKITYHSDEPDGNSQSTTDPSTQRSSKIRIIAIGIALLLIVHGALTVYIAIGMLAFMSMDTMFRPQPCIPFVVTPVLLLLIPSVIGLLRMRRWGIYVSIAFLILFGIFPGLLVLGSSILGIFALALPLLIIYWLLSNRHHFGNPFDPPPPLEE